MVTGRGVVRLIPGDGEWRAWTVLTAVEDLKGYERALGGRRPEHPSRGADSHVEDTRKNWREQRMAKVAFESVAARRRRYWRRPGRPRGRSQPRSVRASTRWCSRRTSALVTAGASAIARSSCTTPCGPTTCRTSRFPRRGRSIRRQGQDRGLAGVLRLGHGTQCLDEYGDYSPATYDEATSSWTIRVRDRAGRARTSSQARHPRHRSRRGAEYPRDRGSQ
jgi:hypothetical protein